MRRVTVSVRETASTVFVVLMIDVIILTVWSIVDPLHWQRIVISEDKYGYDLESEGYCTSDYWLTFTIVIGAYHLLLILTACYVCYLARDLPERFSNAKYVVGAIVSQIQIALVAIPVLIMVGSDPQTSTFVRSVAIFINDFVVLLVIFGPLMLQVHKWDKDARARTQMFRMSSNSSLHADIRNYAQMVSQRKKKRDSNTGSINSNSNSNMDSRSYHTNMSSRPSKMYPLEQLEEVRNESKLSLHSVPSMEEDTDYLGKIEEDPTELKQPTEKSPQSTECSLDTCHPEEDPMDAEAAVALNLPQEAPTNASSISSPSVAQVQEDVIMDGAMPGTPQLEEEEGSAPSTSSSIAMYIEPPRDVI
jgi:7 transmembrane sweet-taste receptor of 3 GCPR